MLFGRHLTVGIWYYLEEPNLRMCFGDVGTLQTHVTYSSAIRDPGVIEMLRELVLWPEEGSKTNKVSVHLLLSRSTAQHRATGDVGLQGARINVARWQVWLAGDL